MRETKHQQRLKNKNKNIFQLHHKTYEKNQKN